MTALLPCPICNDPRPGYASKGIGRFAVVCEVADCQIEGPMRKGREAARAAWNCRATPAEVAALRAERDAAEALGRQWCHDAQIAQQEAATLRARVEALEGALIGTRAALVAATQAALLHNRTPAIEAAIKDWTATAEAARAALGDAT